MQQTSKLGNFVTGVLSMALFIEMAVICGCKNNIDDPSQNMSAVKNHASELLNHGIPSFTQVNLVSNTSTFSPKQIDANLQNAWGIAINPNGITWISANHAGVSVVYDTGGKTIRAPVTIPTVNSPSGGAPTGVVFNSTSDFIIPSTGAVSKFIFAGEDGIISAWSSGGTAIIVADRSPSEAVYKGLALTHNNSRNFIVATDFKGGKIDVFDDHFQYDSTISFADTTIPSGFAPFNIENIGGNLFVTYAKQKGPENEDDEAGPGNGYVDVYHPDGTLISRFSSQGTLNSPWGLVKVPDEGFGRLNQAVLIGNFGDGRINAFDRKGNFLCQLTDSHGAPITIDGLWALTFGPHAVIDNEDHDTDNGNEGWQDGHHGDHNEGDQGENDDDNRIDNDSNRVSFRLFFTAGPNDEQDGLFGYLQHIH